MGEDKHRTIVEAVPTGEEHRHIGEEAVDKHRRIVEAVPTGVKQNTIGAGVPTRAEQREGGEVVIKGLHSSTSQLNLSRFRH